MGCYGCHSRSNVVGSQLVAHWIRHHIKNMPEMHTQAKICCTSGGPENVPKCFFTLLLNSTLSHFLVGSVLIMNKKKRLFKDFLISKPTETKLQVDNFQKVSKTCQNVSLLSSWIQHFYIFLLEFTHYSQRKMLFFISKLDEMGLKVA